ncbi:MAG: glutamate racemase [Bacilli bacterium]
MRVGVFDSGIGGLTVLNEFIKVFPNNTYIYYGDNKNIPYGTKSLVEMKELVSSIISFLLGKNVDIIVIACGTISSNFYDEIKQVLNIPVYEVIGPTIRYINKSNYENVALLATPMTIKSNVFNKCNKNITSIECPLIVPLIEGNNYGRELSLCIKKYLGNINDSGVDATILGCTHYPIVKDIMKRYINTTFINMGEVLISEINISNNSTFSLELYFTLIDDNLKRNISRIVLVPYKLYKV